MQELVVLQITIFSLVAVGYLIKKIHLLDSGGQKSLTNLVINVVLPCNIVTSFLKKPAADTWRDCLMVFLISLAIQLLAVVYGRISYRKIPAAHRKCIQYGIICSNAGFLGNPIAEGLYGAEGLMLASIYLIPQRVMMWSAGLTIFTRSMSRTETLKKVLTHPCVVACGIGLVLMFGGITLPEVLLMPLQTIGRCNTALSMLVIGMILGDMELKTLLDRTVVRYTAERLILIPLLVYAACRLAGFDRTVTGLSVILAAMPAGATTSMLAAKYEMAPEFATKMVVFSTLCSIPSIAAWSVLLH